MEFKKREDESNEDYLNRLLSAGDNCISNLEKIKSDMQKDGVTGFCNECGCSLYKDKNHNCI